MGGLWTEQSAARIHYATKARLLLAPQHVGYRHDNRQEWNARLTTSAGRKPVSWSHMATRYLYERSGSIIGYMDQEGRQLYGQGGFVIANFDSSWKYMHRPDGSVYGYVSGVGKKYLYVPSGEIIGYFQPGFLELV